MRIASDHLHALNMICLISSCSSKRKTPKPKKSPAKSSRRNFLKNDGSGRGSRERCSCFDIGPSQDELHRPWYFNLEQDYRACQGPPHNNFRQIRKRDPWRFGGPRSVRQHRGLTEAVPIGFAARPRSVSRWTCAGSGHGFPVTTIRKSFNNNIKWN